MKTLHRYAFAFLLGLLATVPLARAQALKENHPVGSHVTLFVVVDGSPAPSVEWFKNGAKFGQPVEVNPGTWHLVLGVITAADAGTYTVKATNTVGFATSDPFVLTTDTAPTKPTIKIAVKPPAGLTVEVPAGTRIITTPVSSAAPSSSTTKAPAKK